MTASRTPRPESFTGCMLGLAIGDALGMPVEFLTATEIAERFGRLEDFRRGFKLRLRQGQWTDETQLSLLTLESLIEKGTVIGDDLAERFADLHRSGRARGLSAGTLIALRQVVEQGTSWRVASRKGDHAVSNAPAGRAAPIGLYGCRRPERLKEWCQEAAAVTHDHEEAAAGAAAVAWAVSEAATGQVDPVQLLEQTAEFIGPSRLSEALREASDLAADTSVVPAEGIARIGTGMFVWQSVPAAFYAFRAFPRDFEAAVILAVSAGGDTDTIASIAGAITGAYIGVQGIPPRYAREVEEGPLLRRAAERLFQAVMSPARAE